MATTRVGSCAGSAACTIDGGGAYIEWAQKAYSEEDKTGTIVVVQVINTVLDTTSYSTVAEALPSNYVPPLTNAAGTKIAIHTYTRHSHTTTTTVTYPTPFLEFDDSYTIGGTYQLPSPSGGGAECIIADNPNKTFSITTNPQPPWSFNPPTSMWDLSGFFDPDDPLGWSHSWSGSENDSSIIARAEILSLIDLLPDDNPEMPHAVAKNCKPAPWGSPAVMRALPGWKVVAHTSVVYEGEEGKGAASMASRNGAAKTSDGLVATGSSSTGVTQAGGVKATAKTSDGLVATESSSTGVTQAGGVKATALPKSPKGGDSSPQSHNSGTEGPNNSSGKKNIKAAWPWWAVIGMGALVVLSNGL